LQDDDLGEMRGQCRGRSQPADAGTDDDGAAECRVLVCHGPPSLECGRVWPIPVGRGCASSRTTCRRSSSNPSYRNPRESRFLMGGYSVEWVVVCPRTCTTC